MPCVQVLGKCDESERMLRFRLMLFELDGAQKVRSGAIIIIDAYPDLSAKQSTVEY